MGIDPYNETGNRLRIRRKFSCRCNISRRADKASAPTSKAERAYGFAANFHRKAGVHFEKWQKSLILVLAFAVAILGSAIVTMQLTSPRATPAEAKTAEIGAYL
ncbi:MAG: hypothetical protein ACLRSV_04170 [Oscillospiraceae bacterium]